MPRVGELAQTSVEIFVNFHAGKIVMTYWLVPQPIELGPQVFCLTGE
jgi:hypothetical protein